ncbi:MAG: response regulator [Phenylobacterium zucineum]|nr:MAG: response regulator [Phenylobacterium zucineum]
MEQHRPHVLVVEDDAMIRELIVTRLELAGYRTFTAPDGFQALRRLGEIHAEAMILDLNMPRLDGFEMLQRMKDAKLIQRIPTMILTGRNDPTDIRTCIGLGARDFMAKPFENKQFLARVARLLRKPKTVATAEPQKPRTMARARPRSHQRRVPFFWISGAAFLQQNQMRG